jgi:GNAT superfamily N-acetyltransferase
MQPTDIAIRVAHPSEFDVATRFWISMRRELGMPDADLAGDWETRSVAYFKRRHDADELRWFFADDGGAVVASAAAFLLDGYPSEICTNRRVGYVAGVFVDPRYRRRGLARAVTAAAVEWLWQVGCRAIRLHAAHNARPIYEAMGFEAGNEMILDHKT